MEPESAQKTVRTVKRIAKKAKSTTRTRSEKGHKTEPKETGVCMNTEVKQEDTPNKPKAYAPNGFPDKWALVQADPKREEGESDDVILCVNGYNMSLQRGKWVPVNWAYVECLQHACHPRFSQEPGKQRVRIGETQRYTFRGPHEIKAEHVVDFREILKLREITTKDISDIAGLSV